MDQRGILPYPFGFPGTNDALDPYATTQAIRLAVRPKLTRGSNHIGVARSELKQILLFFILVLVSL